MAANTIQITITVKNLGNKEIGKTAKSLSVLGKTSKFVKSQLAGLGVQLLKGIVAFGASAIKEGMAFTKAMSNVKAITGATAVEFEALSASAEELGRTTKFTAVETAEGMSFMAMAGFEVNEIIGAMPGVLNLAAAGNLDLGKSADIVSNVLKGFGADADQTGRFVDVLTKTFTSSNTSLTQLGQAMKFAAPVAADLDMSVEELAAAMGTLGDGGIQASMAGTTMRTVLLNLTAPVGKAKGLIKELGIEIFDAEGKMLPFPEIIGNFGEAMEDLSPQQRQMALRTIIGKRAISGFSLLLKKGEKGLTDFTSELLASSEEFDGMGTAAGIASEQLDNLAGDVTLLNSAFSGFKLAAFELMEPTLRSASSALTGFLTKLTEGASAWQGVIDNIRIANQAIQDNADLNVSSRGAMAQFMAVQAEGSQVLANYVATADQATIANEAQAKGLGNVAQESSNAAISIENLANINSELIQIETDAGQQAVELARNRSFVVTESDKLAIVTRQIARETEAYKQSQIEAAAAEEARQQTAISLLGVMGTFFSATRGAQQTALEDEQNFNASITNLRQSAADTQLSLKNTTDEKLVALEEKRAAEEHRILTGAHARTTELNNSLLAANNAHFAELAAAESNSLMERQAEIATDFAKRESQASAARAKELAEQKAHLEELKLNAALATLESIGQLAQFTGGLAISANEAADLIRSGVLPVTNEMGAAIQSTLAGLQVKEAEATAQLVSNQAILQEAFAGTLAPIEAQALALGTGIPEAAAAAQSATGLANADIITGAQNAALASQEQDIALQNLGTITFPTLGVAASEATQTINEGLATVATPIGEIDLNLNNIAVVTIPLLQETFLVMTTVTIEQLLLLLNTGIMPVDVALVLMTTVTLPNLQATAIAVAASIVAAFIPVQDIIGIITGLVVTLTATFVTMGINALKAGEDTAKGMGKAKDKIDDLIQTVKRAATAFDKLAAAAKDAASAAQSAGAASEQAGGLGFAQGIGFQAGTPGNTNGPLGLGFRIPPGFPNDSFGPFFAQSGEEMLITPRGMSIESLIFSRLANLVSDNQPASKPTITNVYNSASLTVNTRAQASTVIGDMRVLQSMLGT